MAGGEWHWHFPPVCVEGYGFNSKDKCYYDRSEPDLILDIVYTHEGEQVYLQGFRGRQQEGEEDIFCFPAMRSLQLALKEQGVLWARWEHNGRQMKWNLLTGKITRDKRDNGS